MMIGFGFYDSILRLKGLPILPAEPPQTLNYEKSDRSGRPCPLVATDVMKIQFPSITPAMKKDEVKDILDGSPTMAVFPLIHTSGNAVLIGEVTRALLRDYIVYESDLASRAPSLLHPPFIDSVNQSPIQVTA